MGEGQMVTSERRRDKMAANAVKEEKRAIFVRTFEVGRIILGLQTIDGGPPQQSADH